MTIKDFFKQNWKIITGITILIVLFIISFTILIHSNSILKFKEKLAKEEVDSLHKNNQLLIHELQINRDSIQIFHNLALNADSRDTIYVNQIKYLKTKTNNEISNFNTLSTDSQQREFSNLISEYSKTRFNKDSI